jgi:putative spermidine/putrescine transport system permease protein
MNRNLKNKIKPYLLIAPSMAILMGVFAAGLILGFLQSLGYSPLSGDFAFRLDYYRRVFEDVRFSGALFFSLRTSLISSALSVVIGVAIAYMLAKRKTGLRVEKTIYKLPVVVPHLVAALLVYSILSQSGIVARAMYQIGIIDSQSQFPELIFDKRGVGIIVAYVWKGAPYIAMVTYGILRGINEKLIEAARNLGANDRQIFINILLPISLPTILSSFIIIFAFSFGAFEMPYLLGPTNPRALPVEAYVQYISSDWSNRPYAMAINMVITGISLILIWVYQIVFRKIDRYKR